MNAHSLTSNRGRRARAAQRRTAWVGLLTILTLLLSLFPQVVPGAPVPTASAHNLNASVVYVFFDRDTQDALDARITAPGWAPPQPLLQVGDELGLIIKAVPDLGTTTGVGGYTTFYIPNGLQVVDAAFLQPSDLVADGLTGWDKIPAKGQAQMPAVGAGGGPTTSLVGITRGPNILGTTSTLVTAANANLGTLPGVYGDTGIFYSTVPETAFGTYTGGNLTNNSGDTVGARTVLGTPLNAWDAWQMQAFGISGTTNPAYSGSPIVDSNGRGYAPWGLANVVAGPQSGYAWEFDKVKYDACDPLPYAPSGTCIDQATQDIGPWQRIKYPGSQFSDDPPGANPAVQPYTRGQDASNSGFDLTTGDLPATTGQANGTPNAIRFAFGQLTYNVPEYAWVKVRVQNPAAILDNTGCPKWTVDTFGGDAGGESGGKDHIWRYYDPNSVTFNGCLAIGKPATRELVKVGDTYQYKVKLYNMGANDFSTVQIKDTLPAGVTYVSAVPAPSNVTLPYLTWNVSPFLRGQKFEATVTVTAKSGGLITNTVCATGVTTANQTINSCASDTTLGGNLPLLSQTKSVSPTAVAPNGSVTYQLRIKNIGTGPTGTPVTITDYLPTGFTYPGTVPGPLTGTVNGASVTVSVGGTAARPVLTVPLAINAGGELIINLPAQVSATTTSGRYCNFFTSNQNGINLSTGTLACVDVGGGSIGDTLYRDWDGDGTRDPEDEGLPGITVELQNGSCTPGVNCPTAVTDANGQYLFNGLTAGTYTVVVKNPPAGYTVTADPVGALDGQASVTLAANEKRLDIDFGYRPGGAGTIGDRLFEDVGNDGLFNTGTDTGIDGVTLTLYEDTNADGVLTAGVDALVKTTVTAGGGNYQFTNLDPTRAYLVVATDGAGSPVDTYFTNPYTSSTGGSTQSVKPADFTSQANNVTDADFGYFGQVPGSIGDTVFIDANGNGVFDSGEQTLPGITVDLYQDLNGNGKADAGEPKIQTATTSVTGTYTFAGLGPGNYVVDVDQADPQLPAGYAATRDPIFVSLGISQNRTDVDFPFVQLISKSVTPTTATPGSTLTYVINTNYPGPELLSEAVVSDTVPSGTTYLAGSANANGVYSPTINSVSWALGSNTPALPGLTAQAGYALCPVVLDAPILADTYISKGDPTRNNGGNTLMITRPANTSSLKYGLLKFNVSSIPSGAIIRSATLGLNVQSTRSSNHVDKVYRMLTAWTEGTGTDDVCTNVGSVGATWNAPNCTNTWTAGAFSAADYDANVMASMAPKTKGYKLVDVSTMVDAWVNGGKVNNGLALISTGTDGGDAKYYNRENTTANTDPYLKVVYYVQTLGGCSGPTTLTSVADTYVAYGNETNNYGTDATMVTRPANATSLKHSLLKFDLATIPADATISSATLGVTVESVRASNHADEVRTLLTNWTEGDKTAGSGATWMDADGAGPGDWRGTSGRGANTFGSTDYGATVYGMILPDLDETTKTATVTTAVQNWVNSGIANYGFVLLSTGTDGGDAAYHTREATTASKRPTLTINWSLPPNPAGQTAVRLHAVPFLLGQAGQIRITMEVTATQNIAAVTPPASLAVVADDVTYSQASGPTPAGPVALTAGTPLYFTYVYNVTPGTVPGSIQFNGKPSASGIQFATAFSEGLIVTPPLTFQVTVNTTPGVNVVENVASLEDGGALGQGVPSNPGRTSLSASIGDRVWADLDGDGTQDAGEPGIAGVQVCATPTLGGAAVCATTDAAGNYRIYGLTNNATYNVVLTPATVPAGYVSTYAPPQPRTATAAGDNDADFGLQPPGTGSIGDTVWLDRNSDGALNGTETGLPGITVNLYKDLDNDGVVDPGEPLIQTDVTDANGQYSFTGLNPATYLVVVDPASPVTSPYDGTTTLGAAMGLVSGNQPEQVTLAAGQVYNDADFGYNWGGSIGDTVWWDDDRNQALNGSEAIIPGATVLLYFDADGDGFLDPAEYTALAFMDTDPAGQYLFENLPPGNYLVDVYEDSFTTGGVREAIPTTPDVAAVTLAPQQDYLAADFGYYDGALVEGHVFWDADRNGVFDGAESGLAPVTVTLTGIDKFLNPVTATTTTDASGYFQFIVPEGTYTVTYSNPDVQAINNTLDDTTTPTSYTVTAQAGPDWHVDLLFGVDNSGVIGDYVWNDITADGVQDGFEPGLAGVTVNLYASNGTTWLAATATDANGGYQFAGLPDGSYVVKIATATLPANFGPTWDNNGGLDNSGAATITGGNQVLTVDFGYRYSAPSGINAYSISGLVWDDSNGNGAYDTGEQPIPNAEVTLACGAYGTFVLTTTSNLTGGNYSLPTVPDGTSCTISVDPATLPSTAYVQTGDPDSACPGTGCDDTTTVTVNGAPVAGVNFGYDERFGSISGTVCEGDGDGQCNTGEDGIPGTTVTLTWFGPDGIFGTGDDQTFTPIQTDANGNYAFGNLLPGYYQVVETNLPDYVSLADADGFDPDNISPILLTVGQNLADRDFEDLAPPSMSLTKTVLTPVSGIARVGDTVTFRLTLVNTGGTDLATLALTDTFDTNYLSFVSATIAPNSQTPAGTLTWNTNLSVPLAPNGTITIDVTFTALAPTAPMTTRNSAEAEGEDEFNALAGPETAFADVEIIHPAIGAAKWPWLIVNNADGTYTVNYTVIIENLGDVPLSNVQATDNLDAAFGAGNYQVTGISATGATANSGFNGSSDKNLLASGQTLAAGGTITVAITVKVTPGSNLGPHLNQVQATGAAPGGTSVSDLSDNGTDPDPNGNGNADETGENDPTPVTFTEAPSIGLLKTLTSNTNNNDGSYTLVYSIQVTNLGDVPLSSVQVTDDLASTFAGATGFTVQSVTSSQFTVNGSYNGTSNTNLLASGNTLAVGATKSITLTVRVTPGGYLGPYANQAQGTGVSPAGTSVNDLSDAGPTLDPDGDKNANEPGENDPTEVTFTQTPRIGAAKKVDSVVSNSPGTHTVTYVITVENMGDVPLSNVQVTENLAATFAGATGSVVNSVTSAYFTVNPGFTGSAPNTNLLTGTNTLGVGASGTIILVVTVTPGLNLGPYSNQVTATGYSPIGDPTTDLSTEGLDPDPDNDNNPGNNSDPTPVTFSAVSTIGVAKTISGPVVNNGNGTYDVTYVITVANLGGTPLTNVQVTDILANTFSTATAFTVLSKTSSTFAVNPAYTGVIPNATLLTGTDTLAVAQTGTITVVVRVTPGSHLGPHNNSARATASGPGGVTREDFSDNGTNPDPDGDGQPNELGENDPTPVTFTERPAIGLAKAVTGTVNNGDGSFNITFSILVENLGDVVLNSVQVTDNLASTFNGSASFSVVSWNSVEFTENPSYNGTSDTNLLTTTGNTLAVGASGTIVLTAKVTPGVASASYTNQAAGSGVSPAGATVTDISDAGTDPDTNNDGDGTDADENDPTPVSVSFTNGIAVDKTGPAASYVGGAAIYHYAVTNTGTVQLTSVSVGDNKCSPVIYVSGDTDGDNALDVTETWLFTCTYTVQATDPDPLVNTATATGVDPINRTVTAQDTWTTDLVVLGFGDFVWLDVDSDGVQDAGETTGLYNVPITVSGTDINGNPVSMIIHTDLNGRYLVQNLAPGTYTASVPLVYGGYAASSLTSRTFTLTTAAPQNLDIDFGYALPTGVALVDFVATASPSQVRLTWQVTLPAGVTVAPTFMVWRSVPGGAWKRLTPVLLGPASVNGETATYAYTDDAVEAGRTYRYRLDADDASSFGPWIVQVPGDGGGTKIYLPLLMR